MNNPHEYLNMYRITKRGTMPFLITVGNKNGGTVAYAWRAYAEKPIAKAGGGGYDKRAVALQEAIEKTYNTQLDNNGAAGEMSVARAARKKRIKVEALCSDGNYQELK